MAGGGKASGAECVKMPVGPRADGHQPLLFFVVILSQLDDAYQIDAIVVGFNNRELQRSQLKHVARTRNMAVDGNHQAGNRSNIFVLIDQIVYPQRLLQRMHVG